MINKPISDAIYWRASARRMKQAFRKSNSISWPVFRRDRRRPAADCDLSYQIAQVQKEINGRPAAINAAVSWLVPKAHTPFGWMGQQSRQYFEHARSLMIQAQKN
jgi:hypothetical protein